MVVKPLTEIYLLVSGELMLLLTALHAKDKEYVLIHRVQLLEDIKELKASLKYTHEKLESPLRGVSYRPILLIIRACKTLMLASDIQLTKATIFLKKSIKGV